MSLLLDARKKVELALQRSDTHAGTGTQPVMELGVGDLSAEILKKKPNDPSHLTQHITSASNPRATGQNLFAAKAMPAHAGKRPSIISIAIISGLVLAAGGGYYVWREISPPPMQWHNPTPPAAPITQTAPATTTFTTQTIFAAPAKIVPAENKSASANISMKQSSHIPNGYGKYASPDNKTSQARSLGETTSYPAVPPDNGGQVAGYLPSPTPARGTPVDSTLLRSDPSAAPHTSDVGKNSLHEFHSKVTSPPTPAVAPHDTAAQPIRIEHAQEGDAVDPTLLAAYQAYRSGDFDTARQRYSEALRKNAQNRDALLGMAAIAMQQSQDATAARYYRHVLMLDPRDPAANAGMSSLLGASNVTGAESRLKLLLTQQPPASSQSASLHSALGNLYAEQSRWGDAQQAYSNAYNLEPGNAQFAFNLAVSLDHLGQGKLAVQHYQRALQLDPSGNPGFNRAQAQQRINELTVHR